MEPPYLLISWVNPLPSRFINRTFFFHKSLESHECACCLLSFLYIHWLFPLSACETSPGNLSIYKSTRERVDSKGLYGRCRLHLMGPWHWAISYSVKLGTRLKRLGAKWQGPTLNFYFSLTGYKCNLHFWHAHNEFPFFVHTCIDRQFEPGHIRLKIKLNSRLVGDETWRLNC